MSNRKWTDAQIGLLAQAMRDGHVSREIAAIVGMSSSAVRGKRRRLGMLFSSEAYAATERAHGVILAGPKEPPNPNAPVAPPPLAGSQPRPWTQRQAGECAWPVAGCGDETLSCCLPVEGRHPYCSGHMFIRQRLQVETNTLTGARELQPASGVRHVEQRNPSRPRPDHGHHQQRQGVAQAV